MIIQTKKAFTVAELVVIMSVLAVLGTIALLGYQGYSEDARDTSRSVDIENIKKSLELSSLHEGAYPKPDNYETITYGGDNVWYQGVIGDDLTTRFSDLNEKPLDPLLNTEYIYSVTSDQKEYELLALYEGDMVGFNSFISQTYAADNLYPVINGTYNKIYTKTKNYIVPVPSIISSEDTTGGMVLDATNIKSQVVTNGQNIPSFGGELHKTGSLDINLSVTPLITKTSSNTDKIVALNAIKNAYTGTSIATQDKYKNILEKQTDEDIVNLVNLLILKSSTEVTASAFYSCDDTTKPTDNGYISFVTGSPISKDQVYVQDALSCGFSCDSGYVYDGGSNQCILNECGGSIPANGISNATSQSASKDWAYDEIPGICKFICDTNYTWNEIDTCNADTQSVSCGGSIPTNATATTATTYTQTWNGSIWDPTISWGESQATCDFDCDSGYVWSGSACEIDLMTIADCGTTSGEVIYGTANGTDTGLICDNDIMICNGTTGSGYTIASCNIGATSPSIDWTISRGDYFQWGRNKSFAYGDGTQQTTTITGTIGLNPGTDTYGFVWNSALPSPYTWASSDITDNWGDTTDTDLARQGPCSSGYHIPTRSEWIDLVSVGGWGSSGTNMQLDLKLPYTGNRFWSDGVYYGGGGSGYYWSSSINGSNSYYLYFISSQIQNSYSDARAYGYNIRCFKN